MAFQPYQRELNRQFLSGAIRYPNEVLAECGDITEKDLDPDANRVVFSALKSCIASGQPFSELVLIDRLTSMGIKIGGALEPAVYIGSLLGLAVNARAAISIAKQIKKVTIRRELFEAARKVQAAIEEDASSSEPLKATELVTKTTGLFNEKINLLSGLEINAPVDLYGGVREFIEADNFFSEKSIVPPWPIFTDLWGNWDAGSVVIVASRMKVGKSTMALSAVQTISQRDTDDSFRALILDTELTAAENRSRAVCAISGVKEYRIRHGLYKQNPEEKRKVEDAVAQLETLTNKVSHCFCGNMELDEILSTIRRWAHKNVTDGKKGLIVYDYLKLTGALDFRSKSPLFIILGEKINALKNITKELRLSCLGFVQTNRENVESKAGEKMQNSSVIGGSDMIAQFASHVLLLEDLSPTERAELHQMGEDDATHSLREIACRTRGPCELGEDRMVPYKDARGQTKYMRNYILLNFSRFAVKEVGTIRSVLEKNATMGIQVQPVATTRADLL